MDKSQIHTVENAEVLSELQTLLVDNSADVAKEHGPDCICKDCVTKLLVEWHKSPEWQEMIVQMSERFYQREFAKIKEMGFWNYANGTDGFYKR